ncbi:hypothetical protein N9Y88_05865, partial [Candidatus Pelagibacter bacterium]|nr:hypothetical protein [Candidatus Pelagibacter bacterium]
MLDLIGFTSIIFMSLLTLLLALRHPKIFNVLFVALIVRVILLILGEYFFDLPDSTADSRRYEKVAWENGKEGFLYVINQYEGPHARFISILIAIPYSLFGRSVLMAKSLGLFFGIGSVFLGWKVSKLLWNDRIAKKIAWTIALFPSLILYSVIIMREVYLVFFLLLAIYGIVGWVKNDNFKSIIIALIGFFGATHFHGAMFVGAIVFLLFVGATSFKKSLVSLARFRFNVRIFLTFLLFVVFSTLYLSNKIQVSYLGTFENSASTKELLRRSKTSTLGDASFPKWLIANSTIELIYKAPVRSLYVVFAPFPWDVKKTKHLIGMFDAFLYMYLSVLILLNIKNIWKDPALRIILIILLAYIFVFGMGVGNF